MKRKWLAAAGAVFAAALVATLPGLSPAQADTVIVESRQPGGAATGDPPYKELSTGWANSSGKSTAPGLSGTGCRYTPVNATPDPNQSFKVTPTLGVAGGKYRVSVTHTNLNTSPDIVIGVATTNGSGLPATTDAFQAQYSNVWQQVGVLQLDAGQTTPVVTFSYSSGTFTDVNGRFYADGVKFEYIQPCEATPAVTVPGPLRPGDTSVTVTGVANNATSVKVYSLSGGSPHLLGSATVSGQDTVSVPVSPALTGGLKIAATQVVSGVEGCIPAIGVVVGDVIVESRPGGQNYSKYADTGTWGNSSAKSAAPGTTSGIGCRYAYTVAAGNPAFTVSPTLSAGKQYGVDITTTNANGNTSPDIVIAVTQTNSTGLPATTTAFQRANGTGQWIRVGELTVDSNQQNVSVTFTYASGTLAATGGRLYADAVRFVDLSDPCSSAQAPPVIPSVTGELGAGQTTVLVPGVAANATKVTVYADSAEIGSLSSGVAAGDNTVTVAPLVKGQQITATQTANGIESCRVAVGAVVGGGANPKVRIVVNIREDDALTGPVGATGSSPSATIAFLGATGRVNNGFGNAPIGGRVITPSACWQTVSFNRGPDPNNPIDPIYEWSGPNDQKLTGNYGILDSIGFAIEGTDNGPYNIYIDNLTNGTTLLQDWESATVGTEAVLLSKPSFSGTTSVFLMPLTGPVNPNDSVVSDDYADIGSHSLRVKWQFKDTAPIDWLRLPLVGTGGGATVNPMVDLSKPISFRLLLLPVGVTPGAGPAITQHPQDKSASVGDSVTFTVAATGSGTLSYQWLENGAPVGTNSATLTLSNVQASDNGAKIVAVVCDSTGSKASNAATLTVNAATPMSIGDARQKTDGSTVTITEGQVVTLTGDGFFYMQDAPGNAGIRVESSTAVNQNDTVSITNATIGTNANGERTLSGGTVTVGAAGTTVVRKTNNKSIGGTGYVDQFGLTNQGLLMKIFGKVTKWDFMPENYILVDDGSNVNAEDTDRGIKVISDYFPQAIGEYVTAVGVVGSEIKNGKKIRVLRALPNGVTLQQ
ncbi:MAG: immunoglobulin domain-containing protein [Armatimonadetes bacterium]|nr:immunoglobulin domain-containing protein [Armatimonadota bacterium]